MDQDHAATVRTVCRRVLDAHKLPPARVGSVWTDDPESKNALIVLSYLLKADLVDAMRELDGGGMQVLDCSPVHAVLFNDQVVAHAVDWRCTCDKFTVSLLTPGTSNDDLHVDDEDSEEEVRFGGQWSGKVPSCCHLVAAWLAINKHISLPVRAMSPGEHARVVFGS